MKHGEWVEYRAKVDSAIERGVLADIPAWKLLLSIRAQKRLDRLGLHTVEDVAKAKESWLLREPGLGRGTLAEIQKALAEFVDKAG